MLDQKLIEYGKGNTYPFHMPGHKRKLDFPNPYGMDITEISGFDHLHHAKGVLQDAQKRAARLYGADKTYYLVNGSTCGILAAICAAVNKRDRVLVARNCHKAVYHGIFLQELSPVYLYPKITRFGITGQICKEQVEEALAQDPDIKAVILTSPTYDGIVSDIAAIAETVHSYGIPLIVDEAHGAHFGLAEGFPENAVTLGADAVVVSIHKTLPAFTQTALLHIQGDRISRCRVEEYLDIFETSSPSYLLMAGMDRCIRLVEEKGIVLFQELSENLQAFYRRMQKLSYFHVLQKDELSKQEAWDFDQSKILILTAQSELNGQQLLKILSQEYELELEMACRNYVLAITTIMDTKEGFQRLGDALLDLDTKLQKSIQPPVAAAGKSDIAAGNSDKSNEKLFHINNTGMYRPLERVMDIHQAKAAENREELLESAPGAISHTYITVYPPGIPLAVPGERLDQKLIQDIRECLNMGLEVEGLTEEMGINIVNLR